MKEEIYRFSETGAAQHLHIAKPEHGVIYDRKLPFNIQACGEAECDETYCVERPNSPVTCIDYIIEGKGRFVQDGVGVTAHKGDVCILRCKHHHLIRSDAEEPPRKLWFTVYGEFVNNALVSYGMGSKILIRNCDIGDLMREFIETASQRREQREIFDACSIVFLKILQKLFHAVEKQKTDTTAERFFNLINECGDYSKRINDIIEPLGCSKEHAIREFKREYGISPYKYITQQRMNEAKEMVETTDMWISEIAETLSFNDAHYFSYFFKDYFGISPTALRRQYKERKTSIKKRGVEE